MKDNYLRKKNTGGGVVGFFLGMLFGLFAALMILYFLQYNGMSSFNSQKKIVEKSLSANRINGSAHSDSSAKLDEVIKKSLDNSNNSKNEAQPEIPLIKETGKSSISSVSDFKELDKNLITSPATVKEVNKDLAEPTPILEAVDEEMQSKEKKIFEAHYLFAGAFKSNENAEKRSQQLREFGFVTEVFINEKELFVVRVGPFNSLKSCLLGRKSISEAAIESTKCVDKQ